MNRFIPPGLLGGILLATLASSVLAVDASTPAVKGRAPVASNVVIANQTHPGDQPRVGDALRGSYTFEDADGDGESGTTYQWTRGSSGTHIGTGAPTYKAVSADTFNFMRVEVTPKTDPQTTDPSSGTPARSAVITVMPANVGNFLGPERLPKTWGDANIYCQGLGNGVRLPTRDELQQLFIVSTSATALGQNNTEMCLKYGWPLSGQCEGRGNVYWSSTPGSSGTHYSVGLDTGNAYNTLNSNFNQVTCVR